MEQNKIQQLMVKIAAFLDRQQQEQNEEHFDEDDETAKTYQSKTVNGEGKEILSIKLLDNLQKNYFSLGLKKKIKT